jgi:1-phosphofructokinase/6-phosphofructokinase 2
VVLPAPMPEGITDEIFCEICAFIKERGGIIAWIPSLRRLENIDQIRPWVIKPNFEELLHWLAAGWAAWRKSKKAS